MEEKVYTLEEYIKEYKSMSIKEMTNNFNKLKVKERTVFLNQLSEETRKKFISDIRNQAVADFWTHERDLIKDGKCTRDWTPRQIEDIMNITKVKCVESVNGAVTYDVNGEAYYGHHMLDVSTHPEFAGEWKIIQALDKKEHYEGAHNNNTKEPTKGYYDIEKKIRVIWFKDIDRITFFI